MIFRRIFPLVLASTVACGGKPASSILQEADLTEVSDGLYKTLKSSMAADPKFITRNKMLGAHYFSELFMAQDWTHPDATSKGDVALSQLVTANIKPIIASLTALDNIGTISTILGQQNDDLENLSRADLAASVKHMGEVLDGSGGGFSLDQRINQKQIAAGIKVVVFLQSASLAPEPAKSLSLIPSGNPFARDAAEAGESGAAAASRLGNAGRGISRVEAADAIGAGSMDDKFVVAILGQDIGTITPEMRTAAFDSAAKLITTRKTLLEGKLVDKQITLTAQQLKESELNVVMHNFTKRAQYVTWALGGAIAAGSLMGTGFGAYNAIKSNQNKGH